MRPTISIIVPAYNEESQVAALLENLVASGATEVLLVDGASTDATAGIARGFPAVRLLQTRPNRAIQMNAGAAAATGDVLLFLHADVRLAPESLAAVRDAMQNPDLLGGNLDIRYTGNAWVAALFGWVNRWRRHLGIFYGDSGIFCRRSAFQALGGYQPWPILEDYEFARRLYKAGRLAFLHAPLEVSDRRWRNAGLLATLWTWLVIQGLYTLGVSPRRLGKMYRDIR
ncbi:MAG: TIGR04283 family arsenosugar biosynthesis glycosyltransferase [Candidatus Solibacter usitatus]|nr:TIGR04283 family arsenosugar biosynthesis glycosyltransferase [Candidatus Solibacter usitatus]